MKKNIFLFKHICWQKKQSEHTAARMICRHCKPFPLTMTYALSVVIGQYKTLHQTISEIEQESSVSLISAICPECNQRTVLCDGSMDSLCQTIALYQSIKT